MTAIRVNMSYSVKLEDLGDEVSRLLDDALSSLETILTENNQIGCNPESTLGLQTLREVDTLRKRLADVDIALADISGIVASYIEYENTKIRGNTEQALDNEGVKKQFEDAQQELLNIMRNDENSTQR